MFDDEKELDDLFGRYREACPVPEASAQFMPGIWARIDSRPTFSFVFERLGRMFAIGSLGVFCCVAAANLLVPNAPVAASYADALLSDSSAEQTSYTEAIRMTPAKNPKPNSWDIR
jgi:hypothetical protein